MIDEINLWVQLDELILAERERCRDAEQHTKQRSDKTDHQTLSEKYSADGSGSHSHCLEDADLPCLVRNDHRQVADNVERGHKDDEQQNQPHPELLQLECLEE